MAVLRQTNWFGQWRVDVPHLRAVESAVTADFDLLAGKILTGKLSTVVSGFTVSMAQAVGNPATNLKVLVAGSQIIHWLASESGSIFGVSPTQAAEQLTSINPNVYGGFTASSTNYIGVDLVRAVDSTTADVVAFLNATTQKEVPQSVPLARTMTYRLFISPNAFSTVSNIAPIAKVVTDAVNNVVSVTDARNLWGRLGGGGDTPNTARIWSWASRAENPITSTSSSDPFAGGDKSIASLKDWMDATMTRMWELGGGEYWYSSTADRNIKIVRDTTSLPPGGSENFYWNSPNLLWSGLKILFGNSTAIYNKIADQTVSSAGLTDLLAGECVYVDVQRSVDGATLTPHKAALTSLGTPTVPGSRFVFAWRSNDPNATSVFSRDNAFPVGTQSIAAATPTTLGTVKILTTSTTPAAPVVPTADVAVNGVVAAGISRKNTSGGGSITAGVLSLGTDATQDTAITLGVGGQKTTMPGILRFSTVGAAATPNVDVDSAIAMFIGSLNASAITIGKSGTTTTLPGPLRFSTAGVGGTPNIDMASAIAMFIGSQNATAINIGGTQVPTINIGTTGASTPITIGGSSSIVAVGTGNSSAVTIGTGSSCTVTIGGTTPSIHITDGFQFDSVSGTEGFISASQTGKGVKLKGNKVAAAGGADIVLDTSVARSGSDLILSVRNNAVEKAYVDQAGNIATAGDHIYASAVTRKYWSSPTEWVSQQTVTKAQINGGATVALSGAVPGMWWSNVDASTWGIVAQIPIPIGATITNVQLLAGKLFAGTSTATCNTETYSYNGTTLVRTAVVNNNPQTVAASTDPQTLSFTVTGSPTQVADGFCLAQISFSGHTANNDDVRAYGIRITYTQTVVAPAT